jgi:hypothetical protein
MLEHLGIQGLKVSLDRLDKLEQQVLKENVVDRDNPDHKGSQERLGHLGVLDNLGPLDNQEMQGLVDNQDSQVCKGLEAQ